MEEDKWFVSLWQICAIIHKYTVLREQTMGQKLFSEIFLMASGESCVIYKMCTYFHELLKHILYQFLVTVFIIVENGTNIDSWVFRNSYYISASCPSTSFIYLPIRNKVDWLEFYFVSFSLYSLCAIGCNEHWCQAVIMGRRDLGNPLHKWIDFQCAM